MNVRALVVGPEGDGIFAGTDGGGIFRSDDGGDSWQAVNLGLSGQWAGLLAWTVGALFVPALALALGAWTGSSKPFEVVYVTWWYMVVNLVAPLDFMGVTSGLGTLTCAGLLTVQVAGLPWYYLGLPAVLLALAAPGRWRQTRG